MRINDIDRYYPGNEAIDPLSDFSHEHVVKLHEAVAPATIGLREYEHRTVEVDEATLQNLHIASENLRQIKRMLPYGAGNMKADIFYTQGESWARSEMVFEESDGLLSDAVRAASHQSGHCGEMANVSYVLLAQKQINAPVFRVKDRHWDHNYVVIGDPRDPRWGERNTTIVDSWVRYPAATTLAESVDRQPFFPAAYQKPPGAPPAPQAMCLRNITHVSTASVNEYLRGQGFSDVGTDLLEDIDDEEGLNNQNNERTAVKDPSTIFMARNQAPGGESMDQIAQATIDRQRVAQRAQEAYFSANEP